MEKFFRYPQEVWTRVQASNQDFKPDIEKLGGLEDIYQTMQTGDFDVRTIAEAYAQMTFDTYTTQARAVLRRVAETSLHGTGTIQYVWSELPQSFRKEHRRGRDVPTQPRRTY